MKSSHDSRELGQPPPAQGRVGICAAGLRGYQSAAA
jgi:hypothetical protein